MKREDQVELSDTYVYVLFFILPETISQDLR